MCFLDIIYSAYLLAYVKEINRDNDCSGVFIDVAHCKAG